MDFTTDHRTAWLEQAQSLTTWPAAVKSASIPLDEDLTKLPDTAFADRNKREYPMADSIQTAYSFAYGLINKKASNATLSKLRHRGAAQGIGDFITSLETAYSGSIKQASAPATEYALVIDCGPGKEDKHPAIKQGGVQSFYPISNSWQVEESGRQLALDVKKMPIGWFRKAASRIVTAANKYSNVLLPELIIKYGENRMVSPWAANIIVKERSGKVSAEALDTYNKIASTAEQETDPDNMEKLANLIETLDREYGINEVYRKTVTDPYQVLFGSWSSKEASAVADKHIKLLDVLVPMDNWMFMKESSWRGGVTTEVAYKIKAAQNTSSGIEASKLASEWPAGLQRQLLKALLVNEQAA